MKETSMLERFMGVEIPLLAGGIGVSIDPMSTYQACQVREAVKVTKSVIIITLSQRLLLHFLFYMYSGLIRPEMQRIFSFIVTPWVILVKIIISILTFSRGKIFESYLE